MRPALAAVLVAAVAAAGCASGGGIVLPGAGSASVPGFDTRAFPGESAMRTWAEASPYRWVGYYLPAPCHTGSSWMGRRELLREMGWGIALVFVGEQDWAEASSAAAEGDRGAVAGVVEAEGAARCTRTNLSAERGVRDALEAETTARSEGFRPGTAVFLDVEAVEEVSPAMSAYVRGWFEGMLSRGVFEPALYAHRRNVAALREVAALALERHGRGGPVRTWVAVSGDFGLERSPAASGVEDAWVWQGLFDVTESWGGVTLRIDANVARSASPSG